MAHTHLDYPQPAKIPDTCAERDDDGPAPLTNAEWNWVADWAEGKGAEPPGDVTKRALEEMRRFADAMIAEGKK